MPFDASGRWIPGARPGYAAPPRMPQMQTTPQTRPPEAAPVAVQQGQLTGLLGGAGMGGSRPPNTQFPLNPNPPPPPNGGGVATPGGGDTGGPIPGQPAPGGPPMEGAGGPPIIEQNGAPMYPPDRQPPPVFGHEPDWFGPGQDFGKHFPQFAQYLANPDYRAAFQGYMTSLRDWVAQRPHHSDYRGGDYVGALNAWRAQRPPITGLPAEMQQAFSGAPQQ